MKHNNKGYTLVELMVAIGIGAVVSAGIASLIVISLRMYNNESVNTGMQYELQTTLNQVMDSAMASQGLVLQQKSGVANETEYVALGNFKEITTPGGGASTYEFYGDFYYADPADADGKFQIYLYRIPESSPVTGMTSPDAFALTTKAMILASPKNYLLSKSATHFFVECKSGILDATAMEFSNPVTLNINMTFEMRGASKNISKNVGDQAVMRNRVKCPICVDGTQYKMKKE